MKSPEDYTALIDLSETSCFDGRVLVRRAICEVVRSAQAEARAEAFAECARIAESTFSGDHGVAYIHAGVQIADRIRASAHPVADPPGEAREAGRQP